MTSIFARCTYTLGIRCCLAIDLVSGQNDHIWLLVVEDGFDEFHGLDVGITLYRPFVINDVSAFPETGAEVQIRDLHNLEFAILIDAHRMWFFGDWRQSSPDTEPRHVRATRGAYDSILQQRPAWSWFSSVGSVEDIDTGDGLYAPRVNVFAALEDPDTASPRFPALGTLIAFCGARVQTADAHVDYDLIIWREFFLLFALDVYVCCAHPTCVEEDVLLHSVPSLWIEAAGREGVD